MCELFTVDVDTWVIYGLRIVGDPEYRYVGLTTVGVDLRLKRHKYDSKKYPNRYVCRWVNKNIDRVVIDVLEVCPVGDREYLFEAEQYWISQIRGFGHRLTNSSVGGESGSFGARWTLPEGKVRRGQKHPMYGKNHTQESKDLMSICNLGRVRSESSRRKQGNSIRGEKHWAYGKNMSEETRDKISRSLSGRQLSDEVKQSMSLSRRGVPLSDEHRKKISKATLGENHHNYGKPAFNKGKPSISAHTRWHTNKGVSKPDTCNYCKEMTID